LDGRAALGMQPYTQAEAMQADPALARRQLKSRALDSEPHLPIALVPRLKVQALALEARGQRQPASRLPHHLCACMEIPRSPRPAEESESAHFVGQPAPAAQPASTWVAACLVSQLKGSPWLLFFWAHWCATGKARRPNLARLRSEFKSLIILLSTQTLRLCADGEEATPKDRVGLHQPGVASSTTKDCKEHVR